MPRFLYLLALLSLIPVATLAQTEEPMHYAITQPANVSLTLDGTLTLPANMTKPVPVILLIAGSGPTDRNGNNPVPVGTPGSVKANSYKMLADSLAKLGVAVLRYDKRFSGKNMMSAATQIPESKIRFDQIIDDAIGFVRQLQVDKRFSNVIVAGHSEGSLVGMAAVRQTNCAKFISIAGPADDIASKLKTQLGVQLPDSSRREVFAALDSLKSGYTLGTLPTKYPAVRQVFRPSVQPYLISWMKYNPAEQIKMLNIPVLIIQGERDVQVAVTDAESLKKAKPSAELLLFPEMSHGLKNVKTNSMVEALASYDDPTLPLTPGLATAIAEFVKR